MEILLDTSIIISVLLNEQTKPFILKNCEGHDLYCSSSIFAELGNAFSALFKKKLLNLNEAKNAIALFYEMNLRVESFNVTSALRYAMNHNIYAYDAYLIELSIRKSSSLYTLDKKLHNLSKKLGIDVLE